jgi:hypothetical protein
MEEELNKLQNIIGLKDNDLDYLSDEKFSMKQMFIDEGNHMKN